LKVFLNPSFSARLVISSLGSAPGDRINISGVYASASLKAYSRLKGGGSIYYLPISFMIKFYIALVNFSGLRIRNSKSF
jgi:hypothetical protein